ncbi:hypothetical protein JL721_5778 [Aureococcus anophagefferens]|nr:hypothetical protein JL721_5778 [Aureococcus anophagefferens]
MRPCGAARPPRGLAPDPAAAAAAATAEASAARRPRACARTNSTPTPRACADDARAPHAPRAQGRPIDPVLRDGARGSGGAGDLKRARAQAGKLVRRRERAAARKALAAARPPDADAPRYLPPRD